MGDRFIPNRSTTQFELGHYHVTSQSNANDSDEEMMSPSKKEFQAAMSENLNGDLMSSKIISYKNKAPSAPEGKLTPTPRSILHLSTWKHELVIRC